MMRVRFATTESDYRPMIESEWPWWCTGYDSNRDAIIVAYVKTITDVTERMWPEVNEVEVLERDLMEYTFTSRFPKE